MGLLNSMRDLLGESSQRAKPGASQSAGAYWCHVCNERIPEAEAPEDTPPPCPSCGEEMTFERSPGTANCAC